MFEEGQLYSPVTQREDGQVRSTSAEDHPGVNDADYRARRNEIAAAALAWKPGEPVPHVRLHRGRAGDLAHGLPRAARQAREVRLAIASTSRPRRRSTCPRTACRARQVSDAAAAADRLRLLPARPAWCRCASSTARWRDRVFHSTQYVRHPREPLYTPEPDIIHEVIGHGNLLATPAFRSCTALAGEAAHRLETDEENCSFLAACSGSRVEFGVHRRGRRAARPTAPGILSRYGEIEEFRHMEHPAARPRRDGHGRLRHHPVPAGALPAESIDEVRERGRRLLPRMHRRIDRRAAGAGAAPPASVEGAPGVRLARPRSRVGGACRRRSSWRCSRRPSGPVR